MKPYYQNELTTIYNGDCLDVMDYLIEQGIKVDAIITDPPYGSIKGLQLTGQSDNSNWDVALNWNIVWNKLNKLIKTNANTILFNQLPYGFDMLKENIKNLHHELIWEKNNCAQGMLANIMPLKYHENIYVFRNNKNLKLQKWFSDEFKKTKDTYKLFNKEMGFAYNGGGVASATFSELKEDWNFPNEELYLKIQKRYKENFKIPYEKLNIYQTPYYGKNEKSIIKISKDMTGLHQTQKPIPLMQYLIKTYTKENDLILDFTSGSFTTSVACEQLNRRSIGIELEQKYCDIGIKRLNSLQMKMDI